jgi:NAD(P)-dependent dehydrogenase (short-subunit alcohol dehydrogenase family)
MLVNLWRIVNMVNLQDKVAVVTGASRGVGRGIAHALGMAGATVYVTGRTVEPGTGADNMPGTIAETAVLVTQAGGKGIAVRCDHTVDVDVEALFAQVWAEQGRLAKDMALELKEVGVTAVSLYPGLVRTERVLEAAQWFDMSNAESPEFTGCGRAGG